MPSIQLDKALESPHVKYIRWKTHGDWIEQITIDRRLNQIISCSNDEQFAVVIGCISPSTDITMNATTPASAHHPHHDSHINPRMTSAMSPNIQQFSPTNNIVSSSSLNVKRRPEINETVFKVNKGVKTFDFSFEKNLLITGGNYLNKKIHFFID